MSNENLNSFTSTGSKLYHHQEVMQKLREGKAQLVTSHIMITDYCNHGCSFCSVLTRVGNTLPFHVIEGYLDKVIPLGLKSVILSGGGNPILYKCKETKKDFNDVVNLIHSRGLEIGLITNGVKMKQYPDGRTSWITANPETLDKCTWIRISMSGLDHEEQEVYVPDIDPTKTTLGFSYVYHDTYIEPQELNHGKVSTVADLITPLEPNDGRVIYGKDRLPWIKEKIAEYVEKNNPVYVRLLPNCLEVDKIKDRCDELQTVANEINPDVVFVQYKPPHAPKNCWLGYVHLVLNSDQYCYPCDSVVLNVDANHKFASPWRICHWTEVEELYNKPIHSLVDSQKLCPGCVFTRTNEILEQVVNGAETPMPLTIPTHPNFV